jgi:hypothetical protein
MIKISDKEIKKDLDIAYKEAGQNAYFGNGFEAGVKFALKQLNLNTILPFKIESIIVTNTGLGDCEVEAIKWIDSKRIKISNKVDYVCDDIMGGTCVASSDEFDWSFEEKDFLHDAYVHINLK